MDGGGLAPHGRRARVLPEAAGAEPHRDGRGRCGDGGVLGRARQRRGAALECLLLSYNKIGGEECATSATPSRAARRPRSIFFGDNKIGDEGVRHLSDALARGAAALASLNLEKNKIGDEECATWPTPSRARRGARAHGYLDLDGNPASDAAQQAVKDVLKNRK